MVYRSFMTVITKNTTMDPISIALMGISLLGSIAGGANSSSQNRKIDEYISKKSSDLKSSYDRDYNRNYMDTDVAKSTSTLLQNQFSDALKKLSGGSVVGGRSQEDLVGAADKLKQGYDNSLLRLAGNATLDKDRLTSEFNRRDDNLSSLYLNNLQSKSNNGSNLMANSLDTMGNAAMMYGMYGDGLGGLWGKKGFGQGIV